MKENVKNTVYNLLKDYIKENQNERFNSFSMINKIKLIKISFNNKKQILNQKEVLLLLNSLGNCENRIKEINVIYHNNKIDRKLRIFGKNFIKNNKQNFSLIIKRKKKKN